MSEVMLTFACSTYDRVVPLMTGEVVPEGVDLQYVGPRSGPDIFYDQMKFNRYDVSEMSFSSYLRVRAHGWPYVMLPVFHHRTYAYASMLIRQGSGIRLGHPEDLKGKRVGLADYQQTAGLWARGILQHEFDVYPKDIIWYQERSADRSHGGASGLEPPKGVKLHFADKDFASMVNAGELDAVVHQPHTASVMDSPLDLINHPRMKPLFADPRREAFRYYSKTGMLPAHHITVLRESVAKERPWVAVALQSAFEAAKRVALMKTRHQLQELPARTSLFLFSEYAMRRQNAVFGDDPYPYGIRANAEMIDMTQQISVEQGLTEDKQPWDEMFPEEIMMSERISAVPMKKAGTSGAKAK